MKKYVELQENEKELKEKTSKEKEREVTVQLMAEILVEIFLKTEGHE